jgi:dihydropteroate synthase
MTAGSAPAPALAPFLPRVLWVEGPFPSIGPDPARRLDGLKLRIEDARVAFALTLPAEAAGDLPLEEWASGAELPPATDPRWDERGFLSAGVRPGDRRITVRRGTLAAAAARSHGLAAALQHALVQWSAPHRTWRIADRELALERGRPRVVGIVNVTPDSFSDGGRFARPEDAVAHGEQLAGAGAAVLDVGGESTRPGSAPVPLQAELDRVLPVIERLARRVPVPLSIDTTKAAVARAAIDAGAAIVNDTSALADDAEMARVVASRRAGLVLMHRRGLPQRMQDDPSYVDCSAEVAEHLAARVRFAESHAIGHEAIVLDPGIGFGKRLADNLDLLAAIGSLRSFGHAVLLGASRKRFLGTLVGREAGSREAATLATTAAAFQAGCELVRVHDVAGSVDLLRVLAAIRGDPEAAA